MLHKIKSNYKPSYNVNTSSSNKLTVGMWYVEKHTPDQDVTQK